MSLYTEHLDAPTHEREVASASKEFSFSTIKAELQITDSRFQVYGLARLLGAKSDAMHGANPQGLVGGAEQTRVERRPRA